jgi:hypothetical protein
MLGGLGGQVAPCLRVAGLDIGEPHRGVMPVDDNVRVIPDDAWREVRERQPHRTPQRDDHEEGRLTDDLDLKVLTIA